MTYYKESIYAIYEHNISFLTASENDFAEFIIKSF